MPLSKEELVRYSRQLVIPEIGPAGQEKLKAAKVAVVGAGGLGAQVLACLAGAGVGELGVFDSGPIELSNLHRQFLYGTADAGKLKTELAKRRLLELNPGIKINAVEGLLTAENMKEALAHYDLIADCTDNFATRAAINRACLELGKTYVHAAVSQLQGQLTVFDPASGPCLACLCPEAENTPDQGCAEAGIAGPAATAVASMQALEVMKLILGLQTLKGKFAMLDFGSADFSVLELEKQADCPVCGAKAAADRRFVRAVEPDYITPERLKERLDAAHPPRVLDLRYRWEHDLANIAGDEWMDFDESFRSGAGVRPEEDLVLYCKGQSKATAAWRALKARGFSKVAVLKGGIDAWAEKIDRTMTRY
jgi:adenylyltransferase/sulfurtransferase